jgi:hypothetical protein
MRGCERKKDKIELRGRGGEGGVLVEVVGKNLTTQKK